MRIAVTYDNGQVFQHFGHTEQFKVYEVEDGKVVSAEVVGSDGAGHEALAGLLSGKGIDVLICGGIGGGATAALAQQGIELCAGASGDADEAVAAYLRGELENTGANCDHHGEGHHHEEGGCGENCEEDCGENCGEDCGEGCSGCHRRPVITGKNVGKKVRTHYRGTFNDGTQFDSSYDRGEPLEFICGAGMMILGFDSAVADMDVGQTVNVHLMPFEAYGEADPNAIITVNLSDLQGAEGLTVGQQVYLRNSMGRPFRVKVTAKDDKTITFDANHEMAGKELNFEITLVEIVED
jgi:FKBP-type peptidyl-prolyl cis-trans isomerase 2/predicted Fe-Mo cluster-binding NifX family protein